MPIRRFAHDARNAALGRARGLIAAVAATVLLAACGSDSSTTGPGGNTQKSPDGSYSITTINNAPLPAAIFSDTGGFKLEVMSGTITLSTSGTYSIVTNYRETLPGVLDTYTDSTGGTWTISGTTVSFTDGSDGSKDQATWSNSGQLTFVEPGVGTAQITFIYKLK